MDKEILKELIKNQIEFLKIYSAFIIGLITGISGILITTIFLYNKIALILLIIGFIFVVYFGLLFITSFVKINTLTKKLKK